MKRCKRTSRLGVTSRLARRVLVMFPLAMLLLAMLPALTLSACITHTERVPVDLSPRKVTELARWAIELDGQNVGMLYKLRIEDLEQPEELYKVERVGGQIAGWIDRQGRAFRDEPFQKEKVLVAMDPLPENLRVLLELRRQPTTRRIRGGSRAGPGQ